MNIQGEYLTRTSIPDFTNVDKDVIVDWLKNYVNVEKFERLSDSDITAHYGNTNSTSTSQQSDLEYNKNDKDNSFGAKKKMFQYNW